MAESVGVIQIELGDDPSSGPVAIDSILNFSSYSRTHNKEQTSKEIRLGSNEQHEHTKKPNIVPWGPSACDIIC